tara:strand:- start:39806 stop:40846 length:1041 start_codon:yes stop_codon:yes gene_type:complete
MQKLNKYWIICFALPIYMIYWTIIYLRNLFFDHGIFQINKLPCKVISIGNISTGGTGKTPMVIFLAKLLKEQGKRVAILSRGYRRQSKGTVLVTDGFSAPKDNYKIYGDEPFLISKVLKGVPVVVDENRFRGGKFLINQFQPQIILLDDGYQHRAIARDLDIVLINSRDRKANYRLIPFGQLREPWKNISRANLIIVTKTNLNYPKPFLKKKLKEVNINFFISKTESIFSKLGGGTINKNINFKNKKVIIFSAIADQQSFVEEVEKKGAIVFRKINFRDHYNYSQKDIDQIDIIAQEHGIEFLITTEKDWVKIETFSIKHLVIVFSSKIFFPDKTQINKAIKNIIS